MISERKGDLLLSDTDIIAHQVNYKGDMSSGVAKQIKRDILPKEEFQRYKDICKKNTGASLLGGVLYLRGNGGLTVANLFAQETTILKKKKTNYDALYTAMKQLHDDAEQCNLTVAIPGRIGCGLAGGDWNYVYENIIKPIFEESTVELTIVYWDE